MDNLKFVKLSEVGQMITVLPLIQQQYPDIDSENFRSSLTEMVESNGYQMLVVLRDEKLVAICGYWILRMIYCGRFLQMSNLVVDKDFRNVGIGNKIIDQVSVIAKQYKCDKIVLDSNMLNKKSHSLFFKNDFYIRGFHFMKDINYG